MSYASAGLSGAGTGAAAGATIGSAVPGIGTAAGAVVGGVIGTLAGLFGEASDEAASDKEKREYNEKLTEAAKQYGLDVDELADMVKQYYTEKGSLLDDDAKQEYKDTLTNTDWDALGSVDFDKDAYDVNDYYDQNKEQQIAAAENDALGSANISGSLLGSGAVGQQIAAAVSTENDLADEAYKRMTEDRSFDYGLASDEASRKLDAVKNKLSALGTAYSEDEEDEENYLETMLGLKNAKNSANLQAYMSQLSV